MTENRRPLSVPPPIDPDGSVHCHTEEIVQSRTRSLVPDRPRSATQLPPVEPRSGCSTPYDRRPTSGVRSSASRPGSGTGLAAGTVPEELSPMAKKDPLPPISAQDLDNGTDTEVRETCSTIIGNTMEASPVRAHQVMPFPRVVNYRSGIELNDLPTPEPVPTTIVNTLKMPSLAMPEEHTLTAKDGTEMIVRSIDCQTEWSWLKDMQAMSSTPGGNFSRTSTTHAPVQRPSRLSERRTSWVPSEQSHTGSKSQRSQHSKGDPDPAALGEDVLGVQPGYTDDTYGIPILELSSDSDSLDEELFDEVKYKKHAAEVATKENMMLSSVGPPQILQYQGEYDKKQKKTKNKAKSNTLQDTIFEGQCEFCGANIKPFPSLEDQHCLPPAELYCCDDYREFLQFMLTHVAPSYEEDEEKKLIDITPHAPHGSKLARRAAKERAAQRMREREIQRQQAQIAGMGGGFGGSGGGGGNSNFYQFARQMKTINYQLSSQKCLEEGWTIRPPSPMLEQEPDSECFEPQPILPHWAKGVNVDKKEAGLVQKYYTDGNKFVILFPDGTGNVYYPSGRPAISISSVEKGLFTYLAHADSDDDLNMLAVFDPDGHATSYHSNGIVRVCLDQIGGTELDARGCRKRKWTWKDQVDHVHAPPIQPITFAITPHLAIRIGSQESITLTYSHSTKSCRFQVGARLKLVCKESVPVLDPDEEMMFREGIKNRIETIFVKVSNLLKFPKSPKVDKLSGPVHVTSRQEKVGRLRKLYSQSAKDKGKKGSMPIVTVN